MRRKRLKVELGPLTIGVGAFWEWDASRCPLALCAGAIVVMWTPAFPDWGVSWW